MSPFESLFFCGLYATLPSSVQLLNAEMMDRMLRTTLINNTDSIDQVAQPSMRDALAYLIQCSVRSFNIWLLGSLIRILTVDNYSPLQSLYREMLFFPYALCIKIYSLKFYHLLNFTLHSKSKCLQYRHFYQILLHLHIKFICKCRCKKTKAFAYRFYRPFTQQCYLLSRYILHNFYV